MTDKELLELAAKAAGYEVITQGWNPLTDDGDAFRLAVSLRILFRNPPSMPAWIRANGTCNGVKIAADEPIHDDRASAVRRAIVRVAAEIGNRIDEELK